VFALVYYLPLQPKFQTTLKNKSKKARRLFHNLAEVTGDYKINQTIQSIRSDALPALKSAYKAEFVADEQTKTENPPS
jgi:hypothetical protein